MPTDSPPRPPTTRPPCRPGPLWSLVGVIVVLALSAACSGQGGHDDSSSASDLGAATLATGPDHDVDDTDQLDAPEATPEPSAEDAEAERADAGPSGAAPVSDVVGIATQGRSVIHTATVEVEVPDVAGASRRAQDAVAGVGGLLFGQEATTEPRPRTTLTFKVPPTRFAEALRRLEGLGSVRSQHLSADDVTGSVVDLRSRITTAEVSVARLRSLLEQAATLEQVAALEGQLLERETDLERLRAQLRTIQELVELATIHLSLQEPADEPALRAVVTAYVDGGDAAPGLRCPGDPELQADEGDHVVVCVAITNTGTTPVIELEVRDPGLRLRIEDFAAVEGDLAGMLAPGERRLAWARVAAHPERVPQPQVSAVAVSPAGQPLGVAVKTSLEPVELTVRPDDSLPGFADALGAGFAALSHLISLVLVAVGAALPFAWLIPVAVVALRWARRRHEVAAPPPPPAMAASE
jgi:hypothetical protein